MVYEKNGYKLGKKSAFWFYKELPENVEPVDEFPEGYEIIEGTNHYPFVKKLNK